MLKATHTGVLNPRIDTSQKVNNAMNAVNRVAATGQSQSSSRNWAGRMAVGLICLLVFAAPVHANEPGTSAGLQSATYLAHNREPITSFRPVSRVQTLQSVKVGKSYVLGINRFDLDTHTEILGWQLARAWYLGRQDGLDSGLTLVWQQEANQFSLSKDGLRVTRRF